jgi:linoleoyl-CoA desaturase
MTKPLYSFSMHGEDPFYSELKAKVYAHFAARNISSKANAAMWFKIIFMLSGLVLTYLLLLSGRLNKTGLFIASIILGIFVAGVGCNVAHDALHGTVSKKKWVNGLLGYSMDLLGSNSYLWNINHNNHHQYTNITGLDGDIRENALIRFSPYHPHKKSYRFQVLSLAVVYGAFLLLVIYSFNFMHIFRRVPQPNMPRKHPVKEVIKLLLFKVLYIVTWIILPLHFIAVTTGEFIAGYLSMNFIAGYLLAFNFMAPHNFEETLYTVPPGGDTASWAAHQLYTTANFTTWNKPLEYFIGGLNFQIEHHLFPQVCSIHYPDISPIIKEVADKYNLPYYRKKNFLSLVNSHFKRLRKNSTANS